MVPKVRAGMHEATQYTPVLNLPLSWISLRVQTEMLVVVVRGPRMARFLVVHGSTVTHKHSMVIMFGPDVLTTMFLSGLRLT